MSLSGKAAGSLFWASLASAGARAITIVSTFLLTRYLTPEVQGEVNLAFVLVGTLGAATALGVGQYVAAHRAEDRETTFHGTVLVLAAGALACLAAIASGPAVAAHLGVPGMARHVPGLALSHWIERCGWVPRSLLVREMQFRALGLRIAASELVFATASVTLAALGRGGQSIVLASVARSLVGVAFVVAATSWREWLSPCRLSAATLKKLLRFGLPLSVSWLFRVGATTWDNSLMGLRFGEATVGVYNQAYRLAELPANSVGDPCNDVLVPAFARAPDRESRRRGFLRAASLVAFVIAPMALGLGAVAPALVAVFYPSSYAAVAPLLVVLAPLGLARALCSLAGAFLQVTGRTRSFAVVDATLAALVIGLMAALARWGAVAAATGVILAFALSLCFLVRCLEPDGVHLRDFGRAIARPLSAAAVMAGSVASLDAACAAACVPHGGRLVLDLLIGAAVYSGMSFLIAPRVTADFLGLARGLVARRRAEPEPGAAASSPDPLDTSGRPPPAR